VRATSGSGGRWRSRSCRHTPRPTPTGSVVSSKKRRPPAPSTAFLYEYYEYPADLCVRKNRGVRTTSHKLIHFYEQPEEWELYDLMSDPDETVNLASRRDQSDDCGS